MFFSVLLPRGGDIGAQNSKLDAVLSGLISDWNAVTAQPAPPHFSGFACDEGNLPQALGLISQLQPKFIVGPFTESALKALLAQTTDIPIMSPLGDSASFETPPTTLRTWFCSPNRSRMVAPFQDAVKKITAAVATARSEANVKVTFSYNSAEPDEADFFTAAKAGLEFNGQPASAQPSYYSEQDVNFDPLGSSPVVTQGYQLAAGRPDVILMSGSSWARDIIDAVEQRWTALNPSTPKPVYLIIRTNVSLALDAQSTSTADNWDNRVFALDAHLDSQELGNYAALRARIATLVTSGEPQGAAEYNDCMYAAMFGTVAAASATSTPPTSLSPFQFGQGMTSVSSGSTANEGNLVAADFPKLLGLINGKVNTLLVGTSEYLGFDQSTGVPNPGFDIDCLGSKAGPSPEQWTFAGVSYDATTQASSGSLLCP